MVIKNIITFLILSLVPLSIFFGSLLTTYAQVGTSDALSCPLDGSIWVSIKNSEEVIPVGDNFSGVISLSSDGSYILGGVRVVVAVYQTYENTTPTHWMVLPEVFQLIPGVNREISFDADLSALLAGSYELKVFAIQGDETALLGSVLRDGHTVEGLRLVKDTEQKERLLTTIELSEQFYQGQVIDVSRSLPMTVKIETRNDTGEPISQTKLLSVITQGEIPLGTAVRTNKMTPIKIIPNGKQTTEVTNNFVETVKHTLYVGYLRDGVLLPLVTVPVTVDGVMESDSWPYIYQIGLSDYPLTTQSRVVACVSYVGLTQTIDRLLEPLGVQFTVDANTGKRVVKMKDSLENQATNYFSFTPNISAETFTLTVDLLQQRFRAESASNNEDINWQQRVRENFSTVDTTMMSFSCEEQDQCGSVNTINTFYQIKILNQFSFWHYAGIVLSALLLLYIMLRRLDPYDEDVRYVHNKDNLK